jgi:23S rRNA (pseudouridine1915-N3)-methyltransferase
MRKIKVICVGKTQESYLRDGIKNLEDKLKRFCAYSWLFVKEANYKNGGKRQWLEEEAERLTRAMTTGHYTIACDEKGKTLSSKNLAELFQSLAVSGHSQIDILIGGPYGLSPAIVQSADLVLSLSTMTFTHQMIRLFLTEQVYRAFTIINHIKYHHD